MTSKLTGEGDEADEVEVIPKKHCNFRLEAVTFEPRHENKSCSACPNDEQKHLTYDM